MKLTALLPIALMSVLAGCNAGSTSTAGTTTNATTPIAPPPAGGSGAPTGGAQSGVSQQSGDGGVAAGTQDTVVAVPSLAGTVTVATGGSQTISIAFNSSDAQQITGFAVENATLPGGWSGPASLACAAVGTGSGCVLNLTYAPTVAASGSLTLDYVYVNNARVPVAPGGTLVIPYAAVAQNNVVASVAPLGQVTAVTGGASQPVVVSFATDNGIAATSLDVGALSLPAGWSGPAGGLSCSLVSTGNGCQLVLAYAPQAAGSGTLSIPFSYQDDVAAARTGTVNIPYRATASGSVVALATPSGEVDSSVGGASRAVSVTFRTGDGSIASNLHVTTNLAKLPAGWTSGAGAFSCASVRGDGGCTLQLGYGPSAIASGTLTLTYYYLDGAGNEEGGAVNIPYAATTHDRVSGTVSPAGVIDAVVGSGPTTVTVAFTSDDGQPVTGLQLTGSGTALPAGWAIASPGFSCETISSVNPCTLTLTYAAPAPASGVLSLGYTYLDNARVPQSGSVDISYRGTVDDTVVGRADRSPLTVPVGSAATVAVAFTTDDGLPAGPLSFTTTPAALPPGWSVVAGAAGCASVSSGVPCELRLAYAPAASPQAGTVSLGFIYTNDAGVQKSGSTTIPYAAVGPTP
jgi:hypothetical protein